MSMDHYANYADVITLTTIGNYCPLQLSAFTNKLDEFDITFDDFCMDAHYEIGELDLSDEQYLVIVALCDNLVDSFATSTNINILVGYNDSMGRGCEVDGGFFEASNMQVKNPDINDKLHKIIHKRSYVTYG